MNENSPEINFKEKKEKKGILPWLRARLGFGARGPMGAMSSSAANFGKLGAARFGASAGMGGLLAGKAGFLITAAVVAVGTGVYLANTGPSPTQDSSSFNSSRAPDAYVPAILRSQARNQGSSLDMFKDTNKNAGLSLEENAAKKAQEKEAAAAKAEEQPAQYPNQPTPGDMAQDIMGKLQGAEMGSLTSSLGGGSNKFSNMGGFANKFGQGAVGAKVGFSGGVGSGFAGMPKFDQRKKLLAMKGSSMHPVSKVMGGKSVKGTGCSYVVNGVTKWSSSAACRQAKGITATQQSYTGTSIDSARSTQDKAWENTTGEGGVAAPGAGISEGGPGLVTSPSIDNPSSGGPGVENPAEPVIPTVTTPKDVSPWKGKPERAMMYIMLSIALSAAASYLVSTGILFWQIIGWALAFAALVLSWAAAAIGFELMTDYKQTWLGMTYVIGGFSASAAAVLASCGKAVLNTAQLWMSAIAGILCLIGSMMVFKIQG